MGCFNDCISDMMSPYGNTPLFSAGQTDATVTIVQESYDDGMKVTRIKTPPRTESSMLLEAIDNILGTVECFSDKMFDVCDEDKGKTRDEKNKPDACPECGQDPCVCEDGDKNAGVRPDKEHEDEQEADRAGSEKPGRSGSKMFSK